jgi:hypothetical protein
MNGYTTWYITQQNHGANRFRDLEALSKVDADVDIFRLTMGSRPAWATGFQS